MGAIEYISETELMEEQRAVKERNGHLQSKLNKKQAEFDALCAQIEMLHERTRDMKASIAENNMIAQSNAELVSATSALEVDVMKLKDEVAHLKREIKEKESTFKFQLEERRNKLNTKVKLYKVFCYLRKTKSFLLLL